MRETNVTHTICEFDHLGIFTVLGELRVSDPIEASLYETKVGRGMEKGWERKKRLFMRMYCLPAAKISYKSKSFSELSGSLEPGAYLRFP